MGAGCFHKFPFLLQQILLICRDEEGGIGLDHHHEALEVLQVHVQGLGQARVKVLHLLLEGQEEGLVLLEIVNGCPHPCDVLLTIVTSNSLSEKIVIMVKN